MGTLIQFEHISRLAIDPCLLLGFLIVLVRAILQKSELMILLGLLGTVSQICFIAYDVYLFNPNPSDYIKTLAWETLAMSFSMTGNAIFTFKYWTISLII